MNLDLTVTGGDYDSLKELLVTEADAFYGDRRYGFYNLMAKREDDGYSLSATAYEELPRQSKAAISDEEWDPFNTARGYDPF